MTAYEDLVRKLYAGCGREQDVVQLLILLRQLTKEYFAGDATDQDVQGVLSQVCKTLVAHMTACGKSYTPDQCVKDLYAAILLSPPDNVFFYLREHLRQKKRGGVPSGLGII